MSTTMRRKLVFFLLIFVLSCSASGVYASTDCERWVAQYKQALLEKRAVRRVLAAKHRLHHYAQTKLVGMMARPHTPRPNGPQHPPMHHKMGPLEALKRFELACGELTPPTHPAVPFEITEIPDTGLLPPEADAPPLQIAQVELPVLPGLPPAVVWPPFVIGGGVTPVNAGPGPGPGPQPIVAPVIPVTPLPSPVPEPGSIVLVLTGVAGAIGAMRRRV